MARFSCWEAFNSCSLAPSPWNINEHIEGLSHLLPAWVWLFTITFSHTHTHTHVCTPTPTAIRVALKVFMSDFCVCSFRCLRLKSRWYSLWADRLWKPVLIPVSWGALVHTWLCTTSFMLTWPFCFRLFSIVDTRFGRHVKTGLASLTSSFPGFLTQSLLTGLSWILSLSLQFKDFFFSLPPHSCSLWQI